jgi:hypothetical protein
LPAIRKLPPPPDGERVEDGAVQFGNDWPGLFLRGDYAIHLAHVIRYVDECIHLPLDQRSPADLDHIDMALSCLAYIYKMIQEDVDVSGTLGPHAFRF